MKDVSRQARRIVEGWPDGGWVIGLLPDPSSPGWSGDAALDLVEIAADYREPALLLDLAPSATDLVSRFRATGRPGFAESAAGDAELEEITRRNDERGVSYIPNGLKVAGRALAASESAAELAERVRHADGALFVMLDHNAAEAAASAGWLDGLVRLSEEVGAGHPLPGDLPEWGRIVREKPPPPSPRRGETDRGWDGDRQGERSGEPETRWQPSWDREPKTPPRVILPRQESSGNWLHRLGASLLVLAFVVAVLVSAASVLEGPPWNTINEMLASVTSSTSSPSPAGSTVRPETGDPAIRQETAVGTGGETSAAGQADEEPTVASLDSQRNSAAGTTAISEDRASADQPPLSREAPSDQTPSTGQRPTDNRESPSSADARTPTRGAETGGDESVPPATGPLAAASDSLVGRVQHFFNQEVRFREGDIDCAELADAYQSADRLFVRLSAHFMERRARLDSTERALFNERAEDMDAVDRSFRSSGCSRP